MGALAPSSEIVAKSLFSNFRTALVVWLHLRGPTLTYGESSAAALEDGERAPEITVDSLLRRDMKTLASDLESMLDRPVIEKTRPSAPFKIEIH